MLLSVTGLLVLGTDFRCCVLRFSTDLSMLLSLALPPFLIFNTFRPLLLKSSSLNNVFLAKGIESYPNIFTL